MSERIVELRPIHQVAYLEYEVLEYRIKKTFRDLFYNPIFSVFKQSGKRRVSNSNESPLLIALRKNRISFQDGSFTGKFSAEISKELKSLGATWDGSKFILPNPPYHVQLAIDEGNKIFSERLARIDAYLEKISPAEISHNVQSQDLFDKALTKTDKKVIKSIEAVTVSPKLSPVVREVISREWQNNMDLYIKNFAEEQIKSLRTQIAENVLSGNRYESMIGVIQASYGTTEKKARFLARQETNIMLSKFSEARFVEAGSEEYKWGCVAGSVNHPVRPDHLRLKGETFRWDSPPVTNSKTNTRNNPGCDYNCRCFAIPRFRKTN